MRIICGMANKRIESSKQALILAALCEGMAINSVCRMFKVGKHAVLRVIQETGEACEDWHNRHFRNLSIERLELDEQWAYVHTHKERMTREQRMQNPERGDCWLWASIDPDSKVIVNWRTGKRTSFAAREFAGDLASRIVGRVQITSDQLPSYRYTVPSAFEGRADYAQELKVFQKVRVDAPTWQTMRVNPLVGVERRRISGTPDLGTSTVCHIERFFLTMRQGNKRCARKTLAYSKSWDNHAMTASIHIFVYNLVRVHETLKTTPAVKLGIADKRWTLEHVVAMTERYVKAQEDAAFAAAFEGFATKPTSQRVYEPKEPLTPWYLDPESGGPNPAVKKAGVQYDLERELDEEP
jgi:IS1 family transposase